VVTYRSDETGRVRLDTLSAVLQYALDLVAAVTRGALNVLHHGVCGFRGGVDGLHHRVDRSP
jgi:hypothetical protein